MGQAVDPHFDPHNFRKNKRKSPKIRRFQDFLELLPRFELGTSSLPRMRSTD
ncbi:hypothetical protein BACCAP_04088 [Pseudoflavonifractor capillosus ATCC 29799]|uniref:Uncharacterized protein n=1 Tax=Pseudoflavonifractor capillosus ATCC 29799 TaxID=411467 RepID=A6P0S2_9FIRM|nr:hypothetical protein BACCAP_04088 [Pseudoflavonifractor capillosus ATCC 29799]